MFKFKKNKVYEDELLKKILKEDRIKRYFFLIIGCFLLAVSFNVFFSPNNLVTGGVSGIAIVFNNIWGTPTAPFILFVNMLLLILSYLVLGHDSTKYALIGSILYPIFVYLTQDFASIIYFNVDNMLLISIFGAVLNGIGSGLTFKYGFSTGGGDIICQIISKYLKVTIGDSIKLFNIIIIIGSGFFIARDGAIYAWENVMYAIIIVYIVSLLNDKVLLGISSSKSFYIITSKEREIKDFLISELDRGVTVIEGRGGFTGSKKKILMCVIATKQYFFAKRGILEIDPKAMVLISDVYQSEGIE